MSEGAGAASDASGCGPSAPPIPFGSLVLGAWAFLFGAAMVWYVWWLALVALLGLGVAVIAPMFSTRPEVRLVDPAEAGA